MNLRRFQHFIAVVETGSLSGAASRVGLSQPALSKSIAKLEAELGMTLFDRVGSLELTALGEQVLQRVRRFVDTGADLKRDLMLLRGGEIGEVEVGCGPIIAESLLGPAVARLLAAEPGLHVSLRIAAMQVLEPMLRRRQLDFIVGDLGQLEHLEDYELIRFPPMEVVWFVRPGHPLAGQSAVSIEELFSYPIVTPVLADWVWDWFAKVVPDWRRPFRPGFECSHYPSLIEVVRRTDSICGATGPAVASALQAGVIELIHFSGGIPPLQTGALFLKSRTLSPPAELLLREMVAEVDEVRGATDQSGASTEGRRKPGAKASKTSKGASTRK